MGTMSLAWFASMMVGFMDLGGVMARFRRCVRFASVRYLMTPYLSLQNSRNYSPAPPSRSGREREYGKYVPLAQLALPRSKEKYPSVYDRELLWDIEV